MDHDEAHARVLEAAEKLFYERGVHVVGMDEIRTAAGVPLKRLYRCFPSKQHLVETYLRRRDQRWRTALAEHVDEHATTPADRILAVFDWLGEWFTRPGFRGCAFVNAVGELGSTEPGVTGIAHRHKEALRTYLTELSHDLTAREPETLAKQLCLLVDGAITAAALTDDPDAAPGAREAAEVLLASATTAHH